MPTYDYQCSKCEHSFDKILKMSERETPTKEKCPNCESENTVSQIIVSASSLVSPLSVDGLIRPRGDFRERMKQIKHINRGSTIKDY